MFVRFQEFWAKGVAQKVAVVAVTGAVALCSCCGVAIVVITALGSNGSSVSQRETSTVAAQQATATSRSTSTPQVSHYPPSTTADLQWLAARGDANAVHVASSKTVGLVGVCPQPRREVWVSPSVTGQQLAEDLLAYFYGDHLDSPCGALVVAYNSQGEALGGDAYTAGRVNLNVNDSSGQGNTDPNATHLTYIVTLDIGGALAPQEYTVTYSV